MAGKSADSKTRPAPKYVIDEDVIKETAEKLCQSMDKDASFADFEEAALEAGSDLVRQMIKKNSKG